MNLENAKQAIATLLDEKKRLDAILNDLGIPSNAPRTGNAPDPYAALMGKAIGIRTVTFSQVGRLVAVHQDSLVLAEASCIMDWGRFAGGAAGDPSEVEPYPDGFVIIGRGSIVDCFPFGGKLPLKQK